LCVEHQIAAVGAVQCPWRQQVEVGNESAEASHVLDSPDQSLMGWIVLVNHRGAVLAAIVDDDIDLIAAEARLGHAFLDRSRGRCSLRRLRRGQKVVRVLLDVLLDRVQMLHDIGQLAIAGTQLVHHQRDRGTSRVAIELADSLPTLALPLRYFLHDRFELALHLFQIALDVLAVRLWQRLKQLGRQHLAVAPWCQR